MMRRRRMVRLILSTTFGLAPIHVWAGKNISIFDFGIKPSAAAFVTRDDAQDLAGRVRKVAIDYDTSWNLMDRETIERHLADNGKSYSDCMAEADNKCQTEVARIVGTQLHVSGDISLSAGDLVLTLHLYDIENNKALNQEDLRAKDVKGLAKHVEMSAARLFGRVPSSSAGMSVDAFAGRPDALLAPVAPGESPASFKVSLGSVEFGKSDIFVSTSEPGASLFLDGQLIEGVTPLQLSGIPAGLHKFAASLGNLAGFATVELKDGDSRKVRIELSPATGTLKLGSNPLGARVTMDGRVDLGTTPLRENRIPAGLHKLSFRSNHYWPRTLDIRVTANRSISTSIDLQQTGAILFQAAAAASGTSLHIRGPLDTAEQRIHGLFDTNFVLGSGPIEIPVGRYVTGIDNPRFLDWKDTFDVVGGKTTRRDASVQLRVGNAHLESTPSSEVWKDGHDLGATPLTLQELDPGEASFVFRCPSFDDSTISLRINSGRTSEANIRLRHTRAWLDSTVHADRSARMRTWRWVIAPLAAVAATGAICYHLDAISEQGKANDASSAYDAATTNFESYKAQQNQAARAANASLAKAWIFDSVAGALATAFTLTFVF